MFMGLGMPIPDLSNKPGPGRPGFPTGGSYDFQFEVTDNVTFKAIANSTGTFSISYPDGTTTTTAGSSSITSQGGAGIISINKEEGDTTFCDEFAIVGNKDKVVKVISWGQRTWNKLQDAFKDCTNLTEISTTSLKTDTIGNLNNLFSGCTSLTDVSIKGWNLLSGCSIEGLFDACTNIEKLEATGLAIKIVATSRFAFRQVGSNVANGCEFLMSGLNFSTSTSMQLGDTLERGMFREVKIKPNSNFSNWNLATSSATPVAFNYSFNLAKMLGDNSTLNISNWTFSGTTGSTLTGFFINLETSDSTNRGLNVDITNWNFGNINIVSQFFQNSDLNTVTGLNTLTASNLTNISSFFQYATFLSIPSNDNLSLSFRNAINTTSMSQFSQNLGSALANESDWGAFPNLDGVNLSNCTNFYFAFTAGRYSTGINLGNTTFSTNAVSYSYIFASVKLSAGNGIDLSTTTLKSSNFSYTFQGAKADFIKLGPGIDFSQVGQIQNFAYGAIIPDETLEFATNLSFGNLTNTLLFPAQKMSTCQTDNFIRRLYATQPTDAGVSSGTIYFNNSAVTESPSVVRNTANLLVSPGGWSFNGLNSTDATMPFIYTGSFLTGTNITPTINTSGGTFSSSDVTVDSSTGVFNTSTAGSVTIKYTLPNGCYNEQVLSVVLPFSPFKFRATGPISIKAQPAVAGQSFTIDWGDGSTPVSTTGGNSIASNFTTAGTYDVQINALGDATYCDQFAIVSGQTNVTNVLDWGENPWSNMTNAFSGCTSLSDISTTSFISSTQGDMVTMFNGCTSLLEVDIRNWDLTAGADWYQGSPFKGLANLQKLDMTGLNVKFINRSDDAFRDIGTATTDGCEFLMSGCNWSTSTNTGTYYWFRNSKIKPTSDLSNWVFPTAGWVGTYTFRDVELTGTNPVLNCSGWSTYSASVLTGFAQQFNSGNNNGAKINITGMNVSNVTTMTSFANGSNLAGITGLSTLGATAGNVLFNSAFQSCPYFKFDDNFSNAFIASLNPTSVANAFNGFGLSLPVDTAGPAINLTNLNLSNISTFDGVFVRAHFSDVPDFSTVTFPTSAISFQNAFNGMDINSTSSNRTMDFTNITLKSNNFQGAFNGADFDTLILGNNVDFSSVTTVQSMFYYTGITDIKLPTNINLSSLTNAGTMFIGAPTISTCQVDNLIRSFRDTAYSNNLTFDFYNAKVTGAPSVVRAKLDELTSTGGGGWSITVSSPDATIPFQYGTVLEPNTNITPTNNTGSAFTGTFTSTNSNIAVNSTTGVINTPNLGNTTIRYTLPDGCFTEQAITIATQFFSYEIDTSLYDPTDLTQSFGFTHVDGQSNPISQGTLASWTGSIDVDWGDTTSETLTVSDSTGTNSRLNFNHTYSTGGTYTIKVNFANAYSSSTDATVLEITGFQSTGGNGTSESLKRPRITKVNTFGNTIRVASTKYLTYTNNWALFQGLSNCTQLPSDNLSIHSGYTDSNWYMRTLTDLQKITSAKVGELFTMNASPVTYTIGSGRYIDWVENCYLLETLELKNVNLGRGNAAYIDATSQNCGRDVSVGTQVTIDNINVTDVPTTTYGGHFMQQLGFNNANNKIHKDFVCKNIIISNYAPTTAGVGINPMMLGNATVLANNSDSVYINMTNWKMADNSPLAIGNNAFKIKPNVQDISSGSARTSGWEVDLTSTSQWKLSGSYQNTFSYLPSATVKLTGTANWDITGVTSWYVFCWYGTTTSTIIDMDMSGWEVWNTATMNYFINNAKILTSKYDAALIAWNNNVPGSAAAVNIRLGTSNYTEGGAAEAARTSLIETHGWTISDGGPV